MIGHGSSQSGLTGRWQRIMPRKSHPQQHAYSLGSPTPTACPRQR